ncbi:MAG: hypothetical protein CSA33_09150 [Desulfobulbus propionicus]|nr:MAG: hypothetical protein CSB34_00795 [Desulfobulbus propionicus]PIE57291.1 MAG: hypothetical protein CSA33_09150 [Desulfobulbus propionicus]
MYILERKQFVAVSQERAWAFLQHPANLNDITPPDLHFKIITEVPEVMYSGLIVEYRVSIPFAGTHTWVTEIKHIREGVAFVDEQRLGPYRFWYHYHEIQPREKGVLLIDRVHYEPPFGFLGKLVHWLYIKKTLKRIFDYREQQLSKLLHTRE